MLKVTTPHVYPFGLLNNNAPTPFTLNGASWQSVSHYVYVNMFSVEAYREKMKERLLGKDHFGSMMELHARYADSVFRQAMIAAFKLRFEQHPRLRDALAQTKGYQLVYHDPEILLILNNIRSDNKYVFDPLRGVNVPMEEVLSVISGVEQKLMEDPKLSDNLVYTDLLALARRGGKGANLQPGDGIFLNINYIVPVLKLRMKEKIWSNEMERFKPALLNAYLDFILMTEYPHIEFNEYNDAKKQQIMKEGEERVSRISNHLFEMHLKGETPKQILDKLSVTIDLALSEKSEKELEVERWLEESVLGGPSPRAATEIVLDENSPFLPHFLENIRIEGRDFRSAVHYAFHKKFQLYRVPPSFDVNSVSLRDLNFMLVEYQQKWLFESLKALNENATIQKFTEHPELVFLLLATRSFENLSVVEGDIYLGSIGENLAGRFLVHLRNERIPGFMNPPDILAINLKPYCAWNIFWMKHTAIKYRDKIRALEKKLSLQETIKYLSKTYNIEPARDENNEIAPPLKNDVPILLEAGLTKKEIVVVFPFMVSEHYMLTRNGGPSGAPLKLSEMFDKEARRR